MGSRFDAAHVILGEFISIEAFAREAVLFCTQGLLYALPNLTFYSSSTIS
jgi:hypothetical protein